MFKTYAQLNKLVDHQIIPGYIAAIIHEKELSVQIYGAMDYEGSRLNLDTIYDLASLTKMFTNFRILQLLQDKKLSLDNKLCSILPDFKNQTIHIRELLLHRSGMAASHSGRYTMNREEMIASMMNIDDLINPVDSVTEYSCINYLLLGLVIEAIDKMSLDLSLTKHIFEPLAMKDTGFNPLDKKRCAPTEVTEKRGRIQGIVHDSTAYNFGEVAGNAGLFSTISDMIRFTQEFMKSNLLSNETLEMLDKTDIELRSLGWNRWPNEDESSLYHTGFTGTSILLDPKRENALIILTNRVHPKRDNTAYLEARKQILDDFIQAAKTRLD